MEYPITDALPDVIHTRDRLLAKVYEFRLSTSKTNNPADEDYEILYAYGTSQPLMFSLGDLVISMLTTRFLALVTAQIAKEIDISSKEIEKLFGRLSEDVLQLQ